MSLPGFNLSQRNFPPFYQNRVPPRFFLLDAFATPRRFQQLHDAASVEMFGRLHAGQIQDSRRYVQQHDWGLNDDAFRDRRTANQKGNFDVKLVRHGFALDEAELTQMIAVIGREHDVGVVQLIQRL